MHKLTLRSTKPSAAAAILAAITSIIGLDEKYGLDGNTLVAKASRNNLVELQDATEALFRDQGVTNYAFEITREQEAAETPRQIGTRLKTYKAITNELRVFNYLTATRPEMTMREAATVIKAWQA